MNEKDLEKSKTDIKNIIFKVQPSFPINKEIEEQIGNVLNDVFEKGVRLGGFLD